MSKTSNAPSPALVAELVSRSSKYAPLAQQFIERVATTEAVKEKREAEAVKRVKRKLHQVVGAYLDADMPFDAWLEKLRAAPAERRAALCKDILGHHASTRERLDEMQAIYGAMFGGLPKIGTVLDLACGLNPLARPFMPLADGVQYLACDVHAGLVAFVDSALPVLGYDGGAFVHDLLAGAPPIAADVALMLKTLPCLEQVDMTVGRTLLETIDAPVIVVTYPTASLGGVRRGMTTFYEDRFRKLVSGGQYEVERFVFRTELVFRLIRR